MAECTPGVGLVFLLVISLLGPTTSLITPLRTPLRTPTMAATTVDTELRIAPSPSSPPENERFELRVIDLRVASKKDVKEACDTFAGGFYRPPSAGK